MSSIESADESKKLIGSSSFAVTARVAMQLGRESISSSIVAVLELVKNAYDADAENVRVVFLNLAHASEVEESKATVTTQENQNAFALIPGTRVNRVQEDKRASLVIDDDGVGMDQSQFEKGWMVIGTDTKRAQGRSWKGRVMTGEKGLGRLGLDRLCEFTYVQSFTEGNPTGIELAIDWKKYENTSARLESIKHDLYSIVKTIEDPISGEQDYKLRGTRLILRNLKDDWSTEALRDLRSELSLLVSPFGQVNDFSIDFQTGLDLEELNGPIVPIDATKAAEWKIHSSLYEEDGQFYIKHEMTSPIHKEHNFSFGPTLWKTAIHDARELPRCGPVGFEFYFVRRESKDVGLTRGQIDTFLKANQGIRIYRDGFRVKPYGDPSGAGDWLTLSLRRTQSPQGVRQRPIGAWKVGYNQVVGAVFIGRESNSTLTDQTNREGLLEGPAFYDLRRFALSGVEFFERSRQEFEIATAGPSDFEKAREEAQKSAEVSREAVDELRSAIESATATLEQEPIETQPEQKLEVLQALTEMVARIEKANQQSQEAQENLARAAEDREEQLERQKNTLGNLASLGILAAAFGHETAGAAYVVRSNASLLRDNIAQLLFVQPDVSERINDNARLIGAESEKIETFAKFTLGNVGRDKRKQTILPWTKIVKEVFSSFSRRLTQEGGIEVQIEMQNNLPDIYGFRIDWESILVNLITNAVWALEDTPKEKRKIRLRMYGEDDVFHFFFADSGRGIQPGTEERIFEPTFSTKRNEKGDIIGTGMGLSIIRNLVETGHGGTIDVQSPSDLGGAEFHIRIPVTRRKGDGKNYEQ